MKFEIHFEFRASLRKFQDLNFRDATPRERSPSLGHVTDVPRVIPDSACSRAAVESL
jgi:hypothetical protein